MNILFKTTRNSGFSNDKTKKFFSFDVPLELNEKWMMGGTCLEVYNTVHNITLINSKLQIILTVQQLKEFGIDTELAPNKEQLYERSDDKCVEQINQLITNTYSGKKKLTGKKFNDIEKVIVNIPPFEIENDSIEITTRSLQIS